MTVKVIALRVSNGHHINHCYIVYDSLSRNAVLIDPAWEPATLNNQISRHGLRVKGILLTHHHYDHVDLAGELSQQFQVPCYMSRVEALSYQYQNPSLQHINQAGVFTLGHLDINVVFTPGHTLGSVCYHIGDNLFTGDTLFMEGCGLCWGKGADPVDMFYSLQQLKRQMSDNCRVYPGHRYVAAPGQSWGFVKRNNLYLQFDDVQTFCRFRMRKNQTKLFDFA